MCSALSVQCSAWACIGNICDMLYTQSTGYVISKLDRHIFETSDPRNLSKSVSSSFLLKVYTDD